MKNMKLEELVELRTKLILEGSDISDINLLIKSKEDEYNNYIIESESGTGGPSGAVGSSTTGFGGGGVAYGTSAVSGMGSVVSPQPSSHSGQTISPGYENGGGQIGSGDIGVPYNAGGTKVFQKAKVDDNRKGTNKRRRKKILAGLRGIVKRNDWTHNQGGQPSKPKKILNFNSFQKDSLSKVTKIKE